MLFKRLHRPLNAAVIGASGALGSAFIRHVSALQPCHISACARRPLSSLPDNASFCALDLGDEASIEQAAAAASEHGQLDLVIVASGILHGEQVRPEKRLADISLGSLEQVFRVNTFGPALVAKHFLPKLRRDGPAIFAAISARVGSISDNRLGGWYAYRASKAALNMLLKTASIELARLNDQGIIAGLHPGTVDSALSKPFQSNVPEGKLFDADYSAGQLLKVLDGLEASDSGKVFAWDGQQVPY
ncbi:SDR family NAD(P)-dependent oxidoreductase [Biformimicrobium ophioploci]|uniref:Short-chain dehydrogenase n=1 Tax=Biformimicrobium ophioploci TaxID=3036711 RepID=A0ABQ6LY80_9GAMM|nr:SDR family NAD(P)-dependent oxidoreductase [Microbulbifer sp. NKW57]GMG87059.1 hypothetical protein MNKW57_13800 [Microbulbifer sp. NKW57]